MKTHQEAGRRNSAQVGTFLRCRVAAADLAGVRRRGVYLAAAVGEDLAPISGLLVGSPGAPGQTGLLMRGEINDKSLVRTQLNAEFTPLFRPHRPCSRPPSASSSFHCCCWHCCSQRLFYRNYFCSQTHKRSKNNNKKTTTTTTHIDKKLPSQAHNQTKQSMRIFGIIPFIKLQNNT